QWPLPEELEWRGADTKSSRKRDGVGLQRLVSRWPIRRVLRRQSEDLVQRDRAAADERRRQARFADRRPVSLRLRQHLSGRPLDRLYLVRVREGRSLCPEFPRTIGPVADLERRWHQPALEPQWPRAVLPL